MGSRPHPQVNSLLHYHYITVFGKKYERISENIQDSLAHANASAEEAISSVRTVRSFAAEQAETCRYRKRLNKTLSLRKARSLLEFWFECCTEFTDLIIFVLVLYFGGHLVMLKDLTGGHLIAFVFYSWDMQVGGFALLLLIC